MMMSAAEDQDIVNEQVANKDNRILDYHHFVPGGGAHPISTPRPRRGRRAGIPAAVLRPRLHVPAEEASHQPVPHRLRRHRRRESLSEQHRHVPQGQGARRDDRLRARVRRRTPIRSRRISAAARASSSTRRSATTDALEWSNSGRGSFFPWYAVLNNGLRVTAVGGEDSISSMHESKLVGSARTYVHTGERGLDADAWFEHLRKGNAFVSTGPIVELTVNGRMPGETVALPAGGRRRRDRRRACDRSRRSKR